MTKYRNAAFRKDPIQPIRDPNRCQQPDMKAYGPNHPQACTSKVNSKQCLGKNIVGKPSNEGKRLSLKKVFMVMSRIHHSFKLKYQTLFLALEIYLKYHEMASTAGQEENPEEQTIPEGCLILVSMFLAMKFEEIYPPRLKNILPFTKVDISIKLYTVYQTSVLLKIKSKLNLRTASNLIEQLFKDSLPQVYFQAFYFTEIAYSNLQIVETYPLETIIGSIFYLMTPFADLKELKQLKGDNASELVACSKMLIEARNSHLQNDSTLNRKYSHERYMRVADRPWISLRREE